MVKTCLKNFSFPIFGTVSCFFVRINGVCRYFGSVTQYQKNENWKHNNNCGVGKISGTDEQTES
jgi:hypothetical protein